MTNNNNLIPKENFKKVEEVREIDYKVSSFEEFMKSYEADEEVVDNYELEVDSYGDLRVDKSYGPGSNQSSYSDNSDRAKMERYYCKAGSGLASTIASKAVTPIVPAVTGVLTTAVSEIGYALSSDSDTKDA